MNKNNNLEIIKTKYANLIVDEKYVYKKCCDISSKRDKTRKWLVILEKLEDTKTNENRRNISNIKHAKFRANKLKVVEIINTNKPNLTKKIITNEYMSEKGYQSLRTRYKKGCIAESEDYDENIDNVCSNGLHYFKTIDTAYFYGSYPKNHTGLMCAYYDNGNIFSRIEGERTNNLLNGKVVNFYCSGNLWSKGRYVNDKKSGVWTIYNSNGSKREGKYLNGKKFGTWKLYDKNGSKVGEYSNDKKTGTWTKYYSDGITKIEEGKYANNLKHGLWKFWDCDGEKKCEIMYSAGNVKKLIVCDEYSYG